MCFADTSPLQVQLRGARWELSKVRPPKLLCSFEPTTAAATTARTGPRRPIRLWTSKTNAKMVLEKAERPKDEELFYEEEDDGRDDDDEAH